MLKTKNLLSYVLYSYVLNHKTVLDYQNIPTYRFSSFDIKIITLSTNNIVQTPAGYFRICRRWRRKEIYDKETYRIYKTLIGGGKYLINNLLCLFRMKRKNIRVSIHSLHTTPFPLIERYPLIG